jgi:hypothetical protein
MRKILEVCLSDTLDCISMCKSGQQISRLFLDAPRCREGFTSRRIGAIRHETLDVKCEVTADPRDDVKFSWTYNKSRDVLPVPGSRVIHSGLISVLRYTPESEVDYGTLACWASNSIGRQSVPCLFHIVTASKYHRSQS